MEWNRSDESYADPHRCLLLSSVAAAIAGFAKEIILPANRAQLSMSPAE